MSPGATPAARSAASAARGEVADPLAPGEHVAFACAGAALDPRRVDAEASGDRVVGDDRVRDGVPGARERRADACGRRPLADGRRLGGERH